MAVIAQSSACALGFFGAHNLSSIGTINRSIFFALNADTCKEVSDQKEFRKVLAAQPYVGGNNRR